MQQLRTEIETNSAQVFRLKDVFFPETDDLIGRAGPELQMRGRIIDFSDSGDRKRQYAIIEVEGINCPVVVPVDKLKSLSEDIELEAQHF